LILTERVATAAVVLLGTAAGTACITSVEPSGFVFQYGIAAFGCDTTCASPGTTTLDSAARGDTVWLQHDIRLLQSARDGAEATLRPNCTENVAIRAAVTTVRTIPAPATCQDSTAPHRFALGEVVTRYTQWVVDSGLTPMTYFVVGHLMVQPRIEPLIPFVIVP
jgi:hypothetical protein